MPELIKGLKPEDYMTMHDRVYPHTPKADAANTMQVGGSHYKSPIQHWDYVVANEIPYLEAMVIKYLTRWRKKDGHQDVRKAYHFLIKLAEVEGINLHVEPAAASQEEAAEAGRGYVNQD